MQSKGVNERREDGQRKTSVWTVYKRAHLYIPGENTSIRVRAERELLNSVQDANTGQRW